MKTVLLAISLVLVTSSCSHKITVFTDRDHDFDITSYHTFRWASTEAIEERNNPLYYNELTGKRIREAVNTQLSAKGYSENPDNAELTIHFHIVINDKSVVTSDPLGYHYSRYWIHTGTSVRHYSEETFIIDIMDSVNKNLLWRGWAVIALENYTTDKKIKELINTSVKKIISDFPKAAQPAPLEDKNLKI